MSLINQMLKDLAKRSKPLSSSDGVLQGLMINHRQSIKRKKSFNRLVLYFSISFLIILFLNQSLHLGHKKNVFSREKAASEPPSNSTLPQLTQNTIQTTVAHPMNLDYSSQLTGIAFQVENDITRLRLLLSHKPFYIISQNEKNNTITLILENTQLFANLPKIDRVNSAIQFIHVTKQDNNHLKIIFKLNPGAQLEHLAIDEAAGFPELQIAYSSKPTQPSVAEASEFASKTLKQNTEQLFHAKVTQAFLGPIKNISYDSSVEERYQDAIQTSNLGRFADAINILNDLLLEQPDHVLIRKDLAALLIKIGHFDKALEILNIGLQLNPIYAPYIQLKAQILVTKGKVKEALNLLQSTTPNFQKFPEYYALIAALYQRQDKSNLAERIYEKLVLVQPNNSIWWMGLGIARENQSKNSAALQAFQRANNYSLNPELKDYVEARIHALI